jgi:predicted DNA-binding transcriptional regulator AlpA
MDSRGGRMSRENEKGEFSPLLSPKQVAVWLGISARQVLRLGIKSIRLGHRTIRYRKEDVDARIEETRGSH